MYIEVDKIEPIALEEFLWQSHARGRAVNAITVSLDVQESPAGLAIGQGREAQHEEGFLGRIGVQAGPSSTTGYA